MIVLDIRDYCHDCPKFEADVDRRIFTGPQGRIAETVVSCEWSDACREIHKMFEKQNDKCQGFMGPTF